MPIGERFASTLSAAQAGAEWAIAELYRTLHPALLRYLRARAGAEAEDLASQSWLDAARDLASFRGDEDDFRAWLFTIAARRVTDERRRRRRRPLDVVADETLAARPSPHGLDDELERGRLGDEAARRIVASLPDDQAEVVLLRVVAGLSVEEVARITGRRPGTVRVMQHRALRRLADTLDQDV